MLCRLFRLFCEGFTSSVTLAVTSPRSVSDNHWMRIACQVGEEVLKAALCPKGTYFKVRLWEEVQGAYAPNLSCSCLLQLTPIDQMYQNASLTFTYFYKGHTIDFRRLRNALHKVLNEIPHLAGRATQIGDGGKLVDAAISCMNHGILLSRGRAPHLRYVFSVHERPNNPCKLAILVVPRRQASRHWSAHLVCKFEQPLLK
jgi:hypothetical protein